MERTNEFYFFLHTETNRRQQEVDSIVRLNGFTADGLGDGVAPSLPVSTCDPQTWFIAAAT